jgi:hypothetical protein
VQHRLTAFEFVPLGDGPQLVRLKRGETVLAEFAVVQWLGWFAVEQALIFETVDELVIEGEGVGRPYWDDELPPWAGGFDVETERVRIAQIRRAALELRQRGSLLAM